MARVLDYSLIYKEELGKQNGSLETKKNWGHRAYRLIIVSDATKV